ncbi:MAG: hypothetical protein P1V34_18880 [Alphaproteobacteria bacterium]|nr:hypothetical protein [Alphaproteobacteria bacterium]
MKIGALIPVRLSSERMPGKALMDLVGKPVIIHLAERVAACKWIASPKDVVICTTKDPSDDALVSEVTAAGFGVFRGDKDDIVRRFIDAVRFFEFDAVIQADGDDPLSAPEYMDETMDVLMMDPELDIVTVDGVPLGTATKAIRRRAFDKVEEHYKTQKNDTGFIYYFTKTGLCAHRQLNCSRPEHKHNTARLTLDYPLDLEVFRRIFEALYHDGEVFSLAEAISFLTANPDVVALNLSVEEEYWQRTRDKSVLMYSDSDGTLKKIEV